MIRNLPVMAFLALFFNSIIPGAQRALLIGNDSYPGAALQNARHDASAFAQALTGMHWQTNLSLDVNRQAFQSAVATFLAQLSSNDTALVYYSGHGMQVNGINFMIPVDFQLSSESDSAAGAISLSDLLEAIKAKNVKLQIIILDACRNNPFHPGPNRGFSEGGWAVMSGASGTYLSFGTSPGSTASDNSGGEHGLFTQAILDNLPKNATLDVDTFFRLVREQTITASSGLQVPWSANSLTGSVSLSDALARSQMSSVPSFSLVSRSKEMQFGNAPSRLSSVETLDPIPTEDDDESVRAAALSSLNLLKANRVEEAVRSISSVLANHPHAALALRILALIFQLVGRSADSLREADLAISAAPNDARGFFYRGLAEVAVDPTRAISDEQAALAIDPHTEGAHEVLAQALFKIGQYDAALESAEKALEVSPASPLTYSVLGKLYQSMGKFVEADRSFKLAIQSAGRPN